MRILWLLALIVFAPSALGQGMPYAPLTDSRWELISKAIDAYAENPSTITAQAAIDSLPGRPVPFQNSPVELRANDIIYSDRVISVLTAKVRNKHQESVRLAFKMMNIADGAFAEDLDTLLGKLIPADPSLFLSELQYSNRTDADEGLVGNLGESFSDDVRKQCDELNRRQHALSNVSNPELQSTKGIALAALSRAIRDTPGCK